MSTETVCGWRINLVTRNNRIYGFSPSGLTSPARCHPAPGQDNIIDRHHRSPHVDCECGWRIVTNHDQFPNFFDRRGRHWWRDRVAVQVEAIGPVLAGVDTGLTADPPDTVRARQLRWIPGSKIVVPGRLGNLTDSLRMNYPGRVVVLPSRDWGAFPDAVDSNTSPTPTPTEPVRPAQGQCDLT